MEVKLQLGAVLLLKLVSLAVCTRVTVMEGKTLVLNCSISKAHRSHVEWRNPEGFIMFFNQRKALRDKRYSIRKLSRSQFSISISKVTFSDGGNYTCSHYGHVTTVNTVEVTVIGFPRMSVSRLGGRIWIKCSARATSCPPLLSWKFDNGFTFSVGLTHIKQQQKTFVSESVLGFQSVQSRMTVHCLVQHPALNSKPLINFVKVGRGTKGGGPAASSGSPTAPSQSSTGRETVSGAPWQSSTLRPHPTSTHPQTPKSPSTLQPHPSDLHPDPHLSTTAKGGGPAPSSSSPTAPPQSSTGGETVSRALWQSSTHRPHPSSTHPQTPTAPFNRHSTSSDLHPDPQHLSTTGLPPVSQTAADKSSTNRTSGNHTGILDSDMQKGIKRNSSLLVFLVTCLIVGLLVVLLFLVIKLRKAHMAWKRENEDSDPSEDSSKSRSSQEEKNSHVQRRRGLLNTTFAQYVIQEPTEIVPEVSTAAEPAGDQQHTSRPETAVQTSTRPNLKETAL